MKDWGEIMSNKINKIDWTIRYHAGRLAYTILEEYLTGQNKRIPNNMFKAVRSSIEGRLMGFSTRAANDKAFNEFFNSESMDEATSKAQRQTLADYVTSSFNLYKESPDWYKEKTVEQETVSNPTEKEDVDSLFTQTEEENAFFDSLIDTLEERNKSQYFDYAEGKQYAYHISRKQFKKSKSIELFEQWIATQLKATDGKEIDSHTRGMKEAYKEIELLLIAYNISK